MENIYIECLRLGCEDYLTTGISYDEMRKHFKNHFNSISSDNETISEDVNERMNLETPFINWFFQNFSNETILYFGGKEINKDLADNKIVTWGKFNEIKDNKEKRASEAKSYIRGSAVIKYMEYVELQEARSSSKDASKHALIANGKAKKAIWIAIGGLFLNLCLGIWTICYSMSVEKDNNSMGVQRLELEKEKLDVQSNLLQELETLKQRQVYLMDTFQVYMQKGNDTTQTNHYKK